MEPDRDRSQCSTDEDVIRLQAVIAALVPACSALCRRNYSDPDALRDFMRGQHAILAALDYLCEVSDLSKQKMTEVIQNVWRRYRMGPTIGNGIACQYLITILYERFGGDVRLDWQGWKPVDWS